MKCQSLLSGKKKLKKKKTITDLPSAKFAQIKVNVFFHGRLEWKLLR